jgi:hypothetical protein
MTYRFKSVTVDPAAPLRTSGVDLANTATPGAPEEVWEHQIELSTAQELIIPALTSAFVLAIATTAGFLAISLVPGGSDGTWSVGEKQSGVVILGCVGALFAFWWCRREERKFAFCMKALTDRRCGWRELNILQDREASHSERSPITDRLLSRGTRGSRRAKPAGICSPQSTFSPPGS